ncbi:MAG: hypothetical protein O3A46_04620 [Candidatus Poribacteria bacterium]|nr:hypothetical protein [Candidatus Poribacteria bacterium]
MSQERARIRLAADFYEIEVEGSESFVRECITLFQMREAFISDVEIDDSITVVEENDADDSPAVKLPDDFGAYWGSFPAGLIEKDRILVAGNFVQERSDENLFRNTIVQNLLEDVDAKGSNISKLLGVQQKAGLVRKLASGQWRLTRKGKAHVKELNAS